VRRHRMVHPWEDDEDVRSHPPCLCGLSYSERCVCVMDACSVAVRCPQSSGASGVPHTVLKFRHSCLWVGAFTHSTA